MPMDVNEDELIGRRADDVPKQDPTEKDCMGKRTERRDGESVFAGYCRSWPGRGTDHVGEGRCTNHGGHNSGENGQGAKDGNDNAVTHGAFREHMTSHLTEGEQEAFDEAYDLLDDPEGAQDVARAAADLCLLQFRRSGDERFLRRYESLCDKAGLFPDEEAKHEHSGEIDHAGEFTVNISRHRVSDDSEHSEGT